MNQDEERQYLLLEEDWIPVLRDGQQVSISLREALQNAAAYERIDAGHPLKTIAIYRLVLAILHRALRGPADAQEAAEWFRAGKFPQEALQTYLDKYAHRFYLFGPEPFMQVAGLDPDEVGENFASHWTRLSAEDGSSNTTALFNVQGRPKGERSDALTPAEAVQELLLHQTFALGGLIKRLTTAERAAPVATLALFLAEGENLFQTLCLNLVSYQVSDKDAPPWELPQLDFAAVKDMYDREVFAMPTGRVSRYTWPSRSILLLPEGEDLHVTRMGYAAGKPLRREKDAAPYGTGTDLDPMAAMRGGKEAYPFSLRREQMTWRDLTALLPDLASETVEVVEAGKGGKSKVVTVPGQAPRVLEFAGEVLSAVQRASRPVKTGSKRMTGDLSAPPIKMRRTVPDIVPVSIFGQLTFQGKAFAIRQESYSLPRQVLEDPQQFHNHIAEALKQAEALGGSLRLSTKRLAEALLSMTRDPDPAAARALADQMPTMRTFWAELETPFRQFLLELGGDPLEARANWQRALVRTARDAWALAEEAAGSDSKGLRAVQVAKGPLLAELHKLRPAPAAPTQEEPV